MPAEPDQPAIGHHKGPELPAEGAADSARTASIKRRAEVETGHAEQKAAATAVLARPKVGRLDGQQARTLKDELFADFHAGRILQDFVRLPPDDLFRPSRARRSEARPGAEPQWPFEEKFVLGVGLIPIPTPDHDGHDYRIAVRIQSARRVRDSVLQTMADELDGRYGQTLAHGGRTQVRWTGLVTCGADGEGTFRPWAGYVRQGRIGIGSPINTAGGMVCAVALLRPGTGMVTGLTVGHLAPNPVYADSARRPHVHFPAEPSPPNAPHVGSVHSSQRMPRLRSAAGSMPGVIPSGTSDHAILHLTPSYVRPPEEIYKLPGGGTVSPDIFTIPEATLATDLKMWKLAAKTRQAPGSIRALDVAVEMWDPATGGAVGCNHLVEIELDEGFTAKPGDSGSLIVVDDGTMKPAAILVAATEAGALRSKNAARRTVIYALPLAGIEGI